MDFSYCSGVFIVKIEQVTTDWEFFYKEILNFMKFKVLLLKYSMLLINPKKSFLNKKR